MKENIIITELQNKIRIVYQYIPSFVSCCGVYLNVGSREENNEGIAHLIEHVLFKGTKKRNYLDIINYIENIGGDFNAYTSKEETCLYVTLLNQYIERSIDVLSDVIFNSEFPESEIIKEKQIVIDEINSYKDSPSELIFDEFEDELFKNSSLGHNILGTEKSVKSIKYSDIIDFWTNNYTNERIVVSYVGGVEYSEFINLITKYFEVENNKILTNQRKNLDFNIVKFNDVVKRDSFQSHCMIGNYAYGVFDEMRIPMMLLNNYLGGSNFNSLLNLKLREENGLTYNIESNYVNYSDVGVFTVYFGTEKKKIKRCLDIIKKEFDKLLVSGLNKEILQIAKTQMCGQLALSFDSKIGLMTSNAKSLTFYNRVDSLEKNIEKINNVSNEQIIEVANKVLSFDSMSILEYN